VSFSESLMVPRMPQPVIVGSAEMGDGRCHVVRWGQNTGRRR
jgi:hypothetical protein